MQFSKRLREGVRLGKIRTSVRIWKRPRVKVGGRYPMEGGCIVVDSITPIGMEDITEALAVKTGFSSVEDLLRTARHGSGDNIYLVRFHYLPPELCDPDSVIQTAIRGSRSSSEAGSWPRARGRTPRP